VAEGDACVLASAPAEVAEPERGGRRADEDLVLAGAVTLALSYAFTISVGSMDAIGDEGAGWFTWIPVVGGFLWPYFGNTSFVPWILGITGITGQVVGVVLLALGLVGHDEPSDAPVAFVPSAPGADAGASVAIRF